MDSVAGRWRYGQGKVWSPADCGAAGPIGASGSGWQEHCPGGYAGPHPAQDRPGLACTQVAQALDVVDGTVYRIKRRFAEDGVDGALKDRFQAHRHRKLDDRGEAHLIALACSPAPEGHDHWTLRLLAGKVVELGLAPSLSHETVRLHLKKTSSSPGRSGSGAFPR